MSISGVASNLEIGLPDWLSTRVSFGLGAADDLASQLRSMRSRAGRAVVITGSIDSAKTWQRGLLDSLGEFDPLFFEQTESHPSLASIGAIRRQAVDADIGMVVALGGGSVIDTAKLVAHASPVDGLTDWPAGSADRPLIAVPTTAGSGAEVTSSAAVWDFDQKRKLSFSGATMAPDLAIVDPLLTATVPDEIYADSLLDALVQAVEGSWSTRATADSTAIGLRAVALLSAHAVAARRDRSDADLKAVALAGLCAGCSIERGGTGAAHAFSYPLTLQLGVPHGQACAATLAALIGFNASVGAFDCVDPRGPEHTRSTVAQVASAMGEAEASGAQRRFRVLVKALEKDALRGVGDLDEEQLIDQAMASPRIANAPRSIDRAAAREIFAESKRSWSDAANQKSRRVLLTQT
ncbi:MAG: iron-containing alcohol dehydrogenase [Solirubrobacterales bacterium]